MFENKVKTLLSQGKPAWGAGLPDASDLIAKLTVDTGIDFLWIDIEHRPYDVPAIQWIPIICRLKGCVPIIRVAGLDSQLIKKSLDIGASGIMIPQVNTAEEARLAVQYAKYPPQGTRGVSPLWTFFMDFSYDDYLPFANDETCVVVQIETPDGIKNLEAIAEVEGVDVLFVGPIDLSAVLGHIGQTGHPSVQKFIEEFPARVAKCGKPSGITLRGFDACKKAYDQGYRFIVIGSLVVQGMAGLTADLKKLRELAGN
ncbi:MAG TPA: aldolase/citrate lyase family protein [Acidobacteriota bacterium]|nr:aldolase/citrate lyase family protein [Acidobacteriota bacterium]